MRASKSLLFQQTHDVLLKLPSIKAFYAGNDYGGYGSLTWPGMSSIKNGVECIINSAIEFVGSNWNMLGA